MRIYINLEKYFKSSILTHSLWKSLSKTKISRENFIKKKKTKKILLKNIKRKFYEIKANSHNFVL